MRGRWAAPLFDARGAVLRLEAAFRLLAEAAAAGTGSAGGGLGLHVVVAWAQADAGGS